MLRKNMLIDLKQVDYANFEIDVMSKMNHENILLIKEIINTPYIIYMILSF